MGATKQVESVMTLMITALSKLEYAKKIYDKNKAEALIGILKNNSENESVIKNLKEKGPPVRIFIGRKIGPDVSANLSHFSPVHKSEMLSDYSILFSWEETYTPNPLLMPDVFNEFIPVMK